MKIKVNGKKKKKPQCIGYYLSFSFFLSLFSSLFLFPLSPFSPISFCLSSPLSLTLSCQFSLLLIQQNIKMVKMQFYSSAYLYCFAKKPIEFYFHNCLLPHHYICLEYTSASIRSLVPIRDSELLLIMVQCSSVGAWFCQISVLYFLNTGYLL